MKFIIIVISIIFTCCINSKNTENIQDYFNLNEIQTREYICRPTDSTMKRIFMTQTIKQLSNETKEFEYTLKRADSIPISKGIEHYYPGNQFELIYSSIYELDSHKRSVETKAQIIKGGRKSIVDTLIDYELIYKLKVDSACTLQLNTRLFFHFQFVDSLETECLIVRSKDKQYFHYEDSRHDTTVIMESSRLYAKGNGLVYFEFGNTNPRDIYKLKQSSP